jgi:integrase
LGKANGVEAERDRMLVELLLGTGIRIGSALALDLGDPDFDQGEIMLRTTKYDRPTTAVLPASVAKRLEAFVAERTEGRCSWPATTGSRCGMRSDGWRTGSRWPGSWGSRRTRCAIRSPARGSTARATCGWCRPR